MCRQVGNYGCLSKIDYGIQVNALIALPGAATEIIAAKKTVDQSGIASRRIRSYRTVCGI